MFHWLSNDTKIKLEAYKIAELQGKILNVTPLSPTSETLAVSLIWRKMVRHTPKKLYCLQSVEFDM